MALQLTIQATPRQSAAGAYGSGASTVEMNHRGDLCVAQGLPSKTELARLARSWSAAMLW